MNIYEKYNVIVSTQYQYPIVREKLFLELPRFCAKCQKLDIFTPLTMTGLYDHPQFAKEHKYQIDLAFVICENFINANINTIFPNY